MDLKPVLPGRKLAGKLPSQRTACRKLTWTVMAPGSLLTWAQGKSDANHLNGALHSYSSENNSYMSEKDY